MVAEANTTQKKNSGKKESLFLVYDELEKVTYKHWHVETVVSEDIRWDSFSRRS